MDFGEIEHSLSEKHGPLPTWAYGVLFGAVFIVMRARSKSTTATTTAGTTDSGQYDSTDPTLQTGTIGTTDQTGQTLSDYLATDPTNPAQNVGIGSSGLPGPVSNAQWARVTSDYLLGLGDDPQLVSNALSKYLNGQTLSNAEGAIVDQALTYAHTPPEGVIPVNAVPAPPPQLPTGVTGVTGGFTGGQGDHVSSGSSWGSPTTTHAAPGSNWGVPR